MRIISRALGLCIAILCVLAVFSPSPADAHGIGGLEPSKTNATIKSIVPPSNDFTLESIENGERVRLSQTGNKNIYVLGVDGEKYIRINTDGTFINQKSATRLINQSTSTSKSIDQLMKEYKTTSADPNEEPDWKHISDSRSYSWHDHRTHYMGSVTPGATSLGTNTLPLQVGDVEHTATFEFRTAQTPYVALPFVVLGLFYLAVILCVVFARKRFVSFMSKPLVLIALATLAVLESIHIAHYIKFSQQSASSEFMSSIYGLLFIVLLIASFYKVARARQPWSNAVRSHAPLLAITGFAGLTAGTLIEYRALVDPFPASTLSSDVVRWGIVVVGCLSSLIFAIGAIHIKQEHTPTPQ